MSLRLIVLLAAFGTVAAGCVAPNAAVDPAVVAPALPSLDPSTFLFPDPQNAPHPKFGWPTLIAPGTSTNPFWAPIDAAELPEAISGLGFLAQAPDVEMGGGIAIFGGLAVVPGLGDQSYVVDIRDPAAPVLLSTFEPVEAGHRGAAMIAYPDGRLATVLATSKGFEVWDITDPTMPANLAVVEPTQGGHKIGVVPGTPYVYNANSAGGKSVFADQGTGITEIYDLTDPTAPRHVQDFANGFGCHHIYFWNSAEKQRAICAGIEFTQIWDIADPENPVVIVNVPVHHGDPRLPSMSVDKGVAFVNPGLYMFSHFAVLNDEGNVLIVGDEMGGGGIPPGCVARVGTPARDVTTPFGALWFYDVSVETEPKLLGWFSPGLALAENPPNVAENGPFAAFYSCTAHHGRLVPQADGRDLLAMSFYSSGVVLVDFSEPSAAKLVAQYVTEGQNTWETWYYNGYLFTGDIGRGMDVLTLE